MNMSDNLTLFIAVTAAAVVLQMLILLAMAVVMFKLSKKLQSVTDEVKTRLLPVLDDTKVMQGEIKSFLETSRPKIDVILDNVAHATTTARTDIERIDTTLHDLLDRLRLQVIRVDEMVTHTLDRVEETSDKVQHSVMAPVRHVSGVMQAISVGLGTFFKNQRRGSNGGPSDEMFI
jgi:signal transduction histidine kinase